MIGRETLAPDRLEWLAVVALLSFLVVLASGTRRPTSRPRLALLSSLVAASLLLSVAARDLAEVGWSASYHGQRGLGGPALLDVVEPDFNMDPVRQRTIKVSQRRFSARFSGWMPIASDRSVRLRALHFGAVKVFLDGEPVLSGRPGDPFEARLPDRRDVRSVPLDLSGGWHHWEIHYEPAATSDYAVALELVDEDGVGKRFAEGLVLPRPPGRLAALGLAPILLAAAVSVASALALLGGTLWILLFRRDHVLLRRGAAALERIDASAPVRWVARPAEAMLRATSALRGRRATPWIAFALTVALATPLLFERLDDRPMDGDEVIHGVAAANAQLDGHWYPLHFEGRSYFQKPPLKIWAQAWLFGRSGVGEFQARVLDASATLATVVLLFWMAMGSGVLRRDADPALGMLTAIIFVMSPANLNVHGAREGVQDATLVLATTAAGWFALEALRARHTGRARVSRRWALGAGTALAVGYGVKIFVAFVPALGYLLFEALDAVRDGLRGRHPRLGARLRSIGWMALVPLVAVLGWTTFNLMLEGDDYLTVLHGTLVGRAQGDLGHLQPPGYYLRQIVDSRVAIGSWGALLPFALLHGAWRAFGPEDDDEIRARATLGVGLLATVVTVGLFSLSRAKNAWYIYPAYPWMSLLTAVFALRVYRALARAERPRHLAALGAAGVVIASTAAIVTTLPSSTRWRQGEPTRSPAEVAQSARRLAGASLSIYVLDDHDLPVLGGPFQRHEGKTYRRRMEWLGNVLRSRAPVEIVPTGFEPPGGSPFVMLVRSEEPIAAGSPWLDAIETAARFDPEMTLLGSGLRGEDFAPFPIVEAGRDLADLPACGNLRVGAHKARVVNAGTPSCFLELERGARIRILGRTERATRVDFRFDETPSPWSGSIVAMADGVYLAETLESGSTISMELPAGSFDHRDIEFSFWHSNERPARLETVRIQLAPR